MIFFELFWTFFKIGAFTFGGGYAMLPLIQEAVLTKGWAEPEALINFIAVSESTPGPFAVNMATYVGRCGARRDFRCRLRHAGRSDAVLHYYSAGCQIL